MHQHTLTDKHVASVCDAYDGITVDNCTFGICRPRQRRYVAFDDEIAVNADLLTDLKLDGDMDNYGSNYCRPIRTGRRNQKNELTLTDVDDITYGRERKLKSFAHVDAPSTGHADGGTYDPRQFVSSGKRPASTQRSPVRLQSGGYYLDADDLANLDRPPPDVRCGRGRSRTPDFMDRDDCCRHSPCEGCRPQSRHCCHDTRAWRTQRHESPPGSNVDCRRGRHVHRRREHCTNSTDSDSDSSSVSACSRYISSGGRHHRRPNDRIKVRLFDGSSSVETFLRKFDSVAVYNGWSKRDKAVHLKAALTGSAEQLLLTPDELSYNQLVQRLRDRFGTAGLQEQYRVELKYR